MSYLLETRRSHSLPKFAIPRLNFARDLQDCLGILALLALSAPFRICKLLIPLAAGETDPVSGHHLESTTYNISTKASKMLEAFVISGNHFIFNTIWPSTSSGGKKAGVAR
jgi:hypothetical protein